MGLCRDCKFFVPETGHEPFGKCARWHVGYGEVALAANEVRVENDEGWGMMMGPEFGCVLFQPPT